MNKQEIKEFLYNKPGYMKEGGKRLRNHLLKKGFTVTIKECKQALREIRQEMKVSPILKVEGHKPKILLYDIEVSYGLAKAWRPSYKTFIKYDDFIVHPKIICISWKWNDSDTVETVRWDSDHEDKLLLEQFIPELNKADFIVAHNGDKFDLPWIKTRAAYHDLPMYPKYNTVDTLKIARYDHRLPSNRLDDIGEYFGLGRKIKTEMSLWDAVFNGNEEALEKMIEYCEQDVILLEKVYNKLANYTLPKIHIGTLNGKTKQTSPYNGGDNFEVVKKTTTKAGTIKWLMKDLNNNKYFEMSNASYKKWKVNKE